MLVAEAMKHFKTVVPIITSRLEILSIKRKNNYGFTASGWAGGNVSFSGFSVPEPPATTAITSESIAMNRYVKIDDRMVNTTYSVGAVGLPICRR